MPKSWLTDLTIDEGTLCHAGMNKGANVALFKMAPADEPKPDAPPDEAASTPEEAPMPTEKKATPTAKAEAEPTVDELKARIAELEAQLTEMRAEHKADMAKAEPDDVLKSLDGPVRELVLKAQADAAAAQKTAAEAVEKADKETDLRITREFVADVAKSMPALPAKAEDFGPVLKRIAGAVDKADYDALRKVLDGAAEIARLSKVYTEVGRGHGAEGSAVAEVVAKAAELRKADPKMSDASARVEVRRANPDLAQREREELH